MSVTIKKKDELVKEIDLMTEQGELFAEDGDDYGSVSNDKFIICDDGTMMPTDPGAYVSMMDYMDDDERKAFEESMSPKKEKILFERVLDESIDETVRKIGAISTHFSEVSYKLLKESFAPSAIRAVTHDDVTSKYFIDWYFEILKVDYFADIDPDKYPFSMITHSDEISVYGYFNDDRLDAIIRVDNCHDHYYLSFFFVNKDCQRQGIGQYLFLWVLHRFRDKTISLSVYADNNPAIHIYKKYEFEIVKTAYGAGYRPDAPYYVMKRKSENMR